MLTYDLFVLYCVWTMVTTMIQSFFPQYFPILGRGR